MNEMNQFLLLRDTGIVSIFPTTPSITIIIIIIIIITAMHGNKLA